MDIGNFNRSKGSYIDPIKDEPPTYLLSIFLNYIITI